MPTQAPNHVTFKPHKFLGLNKWWRIEIAHIHVHSHIKKEKTTKKIKQAKRKDVEENDLTELDTDSKKKKKKSTEVTSVTTAQRNHKERLGFGVETGHVLQGDCQE